MRPTPQEMIRRAAWGLGLGSVDAAWTLWTCPLGPTRPETAFVAACATWVVLCVGVAPHRRDATDHAVAAAVLACGGSALAFFGPLQPLEAAGAIIALMTLASAVRVPEARRTGLAIGMLVTAMVLGGIRQPPPSTQRPSAARPDVLLVTVDTWRADSRSGSARPLAPSLTPFMDGLATQGCSPEPSFSTAPLTGPSHAAMLTGSHPIELSVLLNARPLPDVPLLAEELSEAGYRTEAYVSSAMLDGDLGFGRGFDRYDDDIDGRAILRQLTLGFVLGLPDPKAGFERAGPQTLARFAAARATSAPLFVWLHLYDPHRPYEPSDDALSRVPTAIPLPSASSFDPHPVGKPPTRHSPGGPLASLYAELFGGTTKLPTGDKERRDVTGEIAATRYLAEVADTDALVAEAFEIFEGRTGKPPEVWAVVGDHGESLTEHHELGSHQRHLYRANTEVPMLLSPGSCPSGPVSTVHIADALKERAGLAGPTKWDAPALSAVMGPAHGTAPPQMIRKVMLRQGTRELLVTLPPGGRTQEQYNLATDPHEQHPLPVDRDLMLAIQPWVDAIQRSGDTAPSEELRDALEALGYVH